jgi:hypothetical protein
MTAAVFAPMFTAPEVVAALDARHVLVPTIVTSVANVTLAVSRLIAVEGIERPRPALWERTVVPEAGIVAIIHVAVEPVRAMEPRAGSNKQSTRSRSIHTDRPADPQH